MFELGVININKKGKLITWFSISGIDYIKNPRKATHNTSYILNLSFLNIPFVITSI
jgi:hypothetical protein